MRYIRQDLTQGDRQILAKQHQESGRIQRLVASEDFGDVKQGDLGGFIHESATLDDTSWVYDNSMLSRGAHLKDGSTLKNNSYVVESTVSDTTLDHSEVMFAQGKVRSSSLSNTKAIGAKDLINATIDGARVNAFMHGVIGYQVGNGPSIIDSQVSRSHVLGASRVENNSTIKESTIESSEVYGSSVYESTVAQSALVKTEASQSNIVRSDLDSKKITQQDINNISLELNDADLQDLQGLDGPHL